MTQDNIPLESIPEVYRRADLAGAIADTHVAAPIAKGVGALVRETDGMEQWEGIVKFIERVIPLMEKFGKTIMDMRQFEQGNPASMPADDVLHMDNPNPPRRVVDAAPGPAPTPTIAPIKVYALALGALAKLPQDMTIATALEHARANKPMALAMIEQELPRLFEADD
tara:strand:- start:22 stop:525 length:504 start_codon:yes stop_codon:yes gene_type:complete